MPRPPRKKIPFQPTGTRINVPAKAPLQPSSKPDTNGSRPTKVASQTADHSSTPSLQIREKTTVNARSSRTSAAGPAKKKPANAGRPSIGSLRRQSTSRIASSISPEESLVQEPVDAQDSLILDSSDTEASQLVERVNDSFTTAIGSRPLSRRPSMSRPAILPPSAVKPQATPSFLGNFKRRARQPSILRMVQQQSEAGSPSSSAEGETTYFSLDQSVVSAPPASSSRKRKRSSAVHAATEQAQLPSDPAELPGATSPSSLQLDVQIPATAQNDNSDASEQEAAHDEPSLPLHLEQVLSSSPNTSPPSSDLAAAFTAQRRRARRATVQRSAMSKPAFTRAERTPPAPAAQPSSPPMSHATSPLSLPSSSPTKAQPHNRQTGSKRPKRNDTIDKPLRTADLQTLLPRRRTRGGLRTRSRYAEDEFDIAESSSVRTASEDDEPEPRSAKPARRRTGAPASVLKASGAKPAARRQAKAAPTPMQSKGATYARRTSGLAYEDGTEEQGEDEDENEDETGLDGAGRDASKGANGLEALKASAELQAAAQRFKEIDEWELSFESCDANGAEGSSPWR